jgi:hypothetical protein
MREGGKIYLKIEQFDERKLELDCKSGKLERDEC